MNKIESNNMDLFRDLIKENKCEDIITKDVMEWLYVNYYFVAPASVHHHLNSDGGLFAHSYHVAGKLIDLTDRLGLIWDRPQSPFLIGMLHDVCKCDDYIKLDGVWKYKDKKEKMYDGHGVKSVLMLAGHVNLTESEAACIRFHMGSYTTDTEEWNRYNLAMQKYPNVLWTHTADNYAAQIIEKDM